MQDEVCADSVKSPNTGDDCDSLTFHHMVVMMSSTPRIYHGVFVKICDARF
jgi:hypothetical protein